MNGRPESQGNAIGLKLANLPYGLLMNFNVTALRLGLKRLVHPDLFVAMGHDTVNEDRPINS